MPEVSWLFFKAVRAGLAVKHPYLSHTVEREKRKNSQLAPAQRVAMKMGRRLPMRVKIRKPCKSLPTLL